MAILTGTRLAMHFGAQDIFSDIDISLQPGDRVTIVGPNGRGKTTLLGILSGEITPTAGSCWLKKDVRIGYLRQETALIPFKGTVQMLAETAFVKIKQQEQALNQLAYDLAHDDGLLAQYGQAQAAFEAAGGYDYALRMQQVLSGFGFDEDMYAQPVAQLSSGQQARIHFAKLLLEQPDILLLDEPTNHLDLVAIEWLETYLQAWPGAVIIVSHDRYFLDKVVNRVWDLLPYTLEVYRGNYSHYLMQREARWVRQEKEYSQQQQLIAKEEMFIRRNLAGRQSKQTQGRRTRLKRLKQDQLIARPVREKTMALNLQPDIRSGELVLATHSLSIGYPNGDTLLTLPDLEIRRGQCIALVGPNGCGKTTFLKTILKVIPPKKGQIRLGPAVELGYFAQVENSQNSTNILLDELRHVRHNMDVDKARNHLGRFLFSGDDVFKKVHDLSGGELNRLALAKFALSGANFLILDEPTNHLDIPSQEILEAVLADFLGTILLVSHDRYLIDRLATHVWAVVDQSIRLIEGGYQDQVAQRSAKTSPSSPPHFKPHKKQSKADYEANKTQKQAEIERAKQLASLEKTIAATEQRLAQLTENIEQVSLTQDIETLQQLGRDYDQTEKTLAALFEAWIALEAA